MESALKALADEKIQFPLIVKPRWGTGSISVLTAYDEIDLRGTFYHVQLALKRSYLATAGADNTNSSGVIIQEKLDGEEFGVDIVNNLSDEHVCTFIKKKIAMRSGETDAAITVQKHAMEDTARKIGRCLRHTGLLDADIIKTTDRLCLLEMNPRFGGHYPFSHLAGANIPAALIAWASGSIPKQEWFLCKPGIQGVKDISLTTSTTEPYTRQPFKSQLIKH